MISDYGTIYLYIHQSIFNNHNNQFNLKTTSLYGHIGWSFNKIKIFGFSPQNNKEIENENISGFVKNDTDYFQKINDKLIFKAIIPFNIYYKFLNFNEKDYNNYFNTKYSMIPDNSGKNNNCISYIKKLFENKIYSFNTKKKIKFSEKIIIDNRIIHKYSINILYELLLNNANKINLKNRGYNLNS